jgi:hypothetical protein
MNRTALIRVCTFGAATLLAGQCSQSGTPASVGDAATSMGGTPASGSGGSPGGDAGMTGTTGSGGDAPTQGAGGSTVAGTGGSTGGGGTNGGAVGGSSGVVSVASVVPTLDGYLWVGTCGAGAAAGLDCPILDDSNQCPNTTAAFPTQGAFRNFTHTVAGTAGTKYTINFEVRGVAGGKCYTGGTAQAPALSTDPEGATGNNGWYVGGTPIASKWNTYEIHVTPPVPGAVLSAANDNVYYMNSFPSTSAFCERHETFVMKYTASFPVLGGGSIKLVIHDSNCLGQQNCGAPDSQPTCASPRSVDLTGMSPQPANPPSGQPYAQNGFHPQWLLFDVKTVTSP